MSRNNLRSALLASKHMTALRDALNKVGYQINDGEKVRRIYASVSDGLSLTVEYIDGSVSETEIDSFGYWKGGCLDCAGIYSASEKTGWRVNAAMHKELKALAKRGAITPLAFFEKAIKNSYVYS